MLRVEKMWCFLKIKKIKTIPHLTEYLEGILCAEACGRWLGYRDKTNSPHPQVVQSIRREKSRNSKNWGREEYAGDDLNDMTQVT